MHCPITIMLYHLFPLVRFRPRDIKIWLHNRLIFKSERLQKCKYLVCKLSSINQRLGEYLIRYCFKSF